MSIYSRQSRTIHFIHIPKCAGASIRKVLKENQWVDVTPEIPNHLRSEIRNHKGVRSDHIHRNIWSTWDQKPEFQFAIVRNPYDRLTSHFSQVTNTEAVGRFIKNESDLRSLKRDYISTFFDQIKDSEGRQTNNGLTTGGVGFADNHWRPQVDFIGPDTAVYNFETEVDSLIKDLKDRDIISKDSQIAHERKSVPMFDNREIPWREMLQFHDEFVNFYRLDFELFGYQAENF
jgi:hypothetical protein